MPTNPLPGRLARGAALLAALFFALPAAGQQQTAAAASAQPLSLDDALRLAEDASETVSMARAGVTRSRGELMRARSQRMPQVNGSLAYTRALASEFEGLGGGGQDTTTGPPPPTNCGRFTPNPALPTGQRLDSLEHAVNCAVNSNPFAAFGDLPFGRENTWSFGLSVAQPVFTGGRIAAAGRIAEAGRRAAELELAAQRAQLALDVTEAYYNAALADRLVEIAEATSAQAEATLSQTRIARQVGNQPEFELLRAQVTRDNLTPVLIQRRSDRQLAYTRLRLLLDLSADAPLTLTTPLAEDENVSVARFAGNERPLGDTAVAERVAVQQAATLVTVQEGLERIARSQRWPTLSLVSQYGRVAYPTGAFPALDDFRSNWTVGAQLTMPLFTGGRVRGDELVAEANLMEARARLRQVNDYARLDTRTALERLRAAVAAYEASSGTVEQAQRAYTIAEVRHREGISTQVELSDSRIMLQQAQANRALAARDLHIARTRMALLPYLPLQGGAQSQQTQQQVQQQTQQQTPRQQPAADTQQAFTGAGVP